MENVGGLKKFHLSRFFLLSAAPTPVRTYISFFRQYSTKADFPFYRVPLSSFYCIVPDSDSFHSGYSMSSKVSQKLQNQSIFRLPKLRIKMSKLNIDLSNLVAEVLKLNENDITTLSQNFNQRQNFRYAAAKCLASAVEFSLNTETAPFCIQRTSDNRAQVQPRWFISNNWTKTIMTVSGGQLFSIFYWKALFSATSHWISRWILSEVPLIFLEKRSRKPFLYSE